MRIFITGGTGFVGGHIIDTLRKEGHKVVALTRSNDHNAKRLVEKGVTIVTGDVLDRGSFSESLKDINAVIHLVGIIVEARGEGSYQEVHYTGTKNVVDAVKEAGIKKYVHMSALGAEKDSISEYHKSKFKAEEHVKASGLEYTIFKPSVIHGKGDAFVNMYARMLKLFPFVPIIGDGLVKMQPVYVKDIAKLFSMAVSSDKYNGGTYEVGGPEALTFDEIVDTIARVMGKKARKIHMPIKLMKVNATIMRPLMKRPPISGDQLLMLMKDNICDTGKVRKDFAIEFVKFEDGINNYLM